MEELPAPAATPHPDAVHANDHGTWHALRADIENLPDCRRGGQVQHRLADVIFTALACIISLWDGYTDMETFAQTQLAWLRRYVPLANGAPSHDTFRYVFSLLEPHALLCNLQDWAGCLRGRHICVDGKVSRTKDPETGKATLHLLARHRRRHRGQRRQRLLPHHRRRRHRHHRQPTPLHPRGV
jgi:hypothetical protein